MKVSPFCKVGSRSVLVAVMDEVEHTHGPTAAFSSSVTLE